MCETRNHAQSGLQLSFRDETEARKKGAQNANSFFKKIFQIKGRHLFEVFFVCVSELLLLLYNINQGPTLLNTLRNLCMLCLQYHNPVNE